MTSGANAGRPAEQDPQSATRSRLDSMSPAKRALFEKRLGALRHRADDALRPIPRGGDLPVSSAQRRLWFMEQLTPGTATFNVPTALRLSGRIRIDVLTDAVRALFARHEALRTVFGANEGAPVQRILPGVEVDLTPVTCPARMRKPSPPPCATRRCVPSRSPRARWRAWRCSARRPPSTCCC